MEKIIWKKYKYIKKIKSINNNRNRNRNSNIKKSKKKDKDKKIHQVAQEWRHFN
jgi:hypothetical protein